MAGIIFGNGPVRTKILFFKKKGPFFDSPSPLSFPATPLQMPMCLVSPDLLNLPPQPFRHWNCSPDLSYVPAFGWPLCVAWCIFLIWTSKKFLVVKLFPQKLHTLPLYFALHLFRAMCLSCSPCVRNILVGQTGHLKTCSAWVNMWFLRACLKVKNSEHCSQKWHLSRRFRWCSLKCLFTLSLWKCWLQPLHLMTPVFSLE